MKNKSLDVNKTCSHTKLYQHRFTSLDCKSTAQKIDDGEHRQSDDRHTSFQKRFGLLNV